MEVLDLLDVDHPLGRNHVVLHQGEQVCTAGENFGVAPGRAQQADGLGTAGRAGIFKRSHHAPAFCPRAARTRSGVSGRKGTRTPIAFATALEMAAPGEITGGSPNPMTPRSS